MQTNERITWRNGWRLNGEPSCAADVQELFEERRMAKKWEIYEQRKAEMQENCIFLTPSDYENACRYLADVLGI